VSFTRYGYVYSLWRPIPLLPEAPHGLIPAVHPRGRMEAVDEPGMSSGDPGCDQSTQEVLGIWNWYNRSDLCSSKASHEQIYAASRGRFVPRPHVL
jgi:hypothetical protein